MTGWFQKDSAQPTGVLKLVTRCGRRASHCGGVSGCGAEALVVRASVEAAQPLLLRGMWNLPGPGIEPVSPALAGGFLSAVPPGEPVP